MLRNKNGFEPDLKKQRQLSILDLFSPISSRKQSKAKTDLKTDETSISLSFESAEKPSAIDESCMNLQKSGRKSFKQVQQLSSVASQLFSDKATDSERFGSCSSTFSEASHKTSKMSGSPTNDWSTSESLPAISSTHSGDEFSSKKEAPDSHCDNKPSSVIPDNMNKTDHPSSLVPTSKDTPESQTVENIDTQENYRHTPSRMGMPFDQLKTMPSCSRPLPELATTLNHAVLFDEKYTGIGPPPPRFPLYKDAWDSNHVRLPCSPKNMYPVKDNANEETLTSRWEFIESSLLVNIQSSIDLEECILSYNSRYANLWKFHALHKLFTEDVDTEYSDRFFSKTLPAMINLALLLPRICTEPIPLLQRQHNFKLTMTQQQIACLMCNAFLCTFPWRNSYRRGSVYANYPNINFSRLFTSEMVEERSSEKLKTLLHYFERVTNDMPNGTVTFERRAMETFPSWNQSPCQLCGLHLDSVGRIEKEGAGMLQVDFANCFIGGGVLGYGLVQEEIRFCICPELIVSTLFTERMDENECVVITGAEQYSTYRGYASTYQWTGNYNDNTPRDTWGRRVTQIVAMDALHFNRTATQYTPTNVRRELNKAFCGFFCDFDPDHAPAIATGNWGCGVFGGNPVLKALIQLMAAAALGRDLCYFTFYDAKLQESLHEMHKFILKNQLKICDLWQIIVRYNKEVIGGNRRSDEDLFQFMQRIYLEYNDSTDEE